MTFIYGGYAACRPRGLDNKNQLPHLFRHSLIMANPDPSVRLTKRRRTGQKRAPMVEDDESSLDTAMYKTVGPSTLSGSTRQKVLVPIRLIEPIRSKPTADSEPNPDPDQWASAEMNHFASQESEMDTNGPDSVSNSQPKQRWFYMKEFVSRSDSILRALMAREALPEASWCSECAVGVGKWRCCDCTSGNVLCRACMRHSHISNPFHRIECWTGSYFRNAALWEVGVYLCLHHHEAPTVCSNLKWQQDILEGFQVKKDQLDLIGQNLTPTIKMRDATDPAASGPDSDLERESALDEAAITLLDQMLQGHNPENILEDNDEECGHEAEIEVEDIDVGVAGFVNYIQHDLPVPAPGPASDAQSAGTSAPQAPGRDALNNQYVRVVHTNGIHHIALVCCSCRGQENIISDLFYACMVPTSFERIRTVFTTSVLDHFRYCNLEMRSSAYQFFQMLRRITLPLTPSKVVNLYHELRRLSRLWRWVKKLKWAGYGQRPDRSIKPQPGELANFCPACPQVGINVSDNWTEDPNRWVFRRMFVADGNFKADHVRQKSAADDIWLSDGLGMTCRRSECNAFLTTAQERATVSRPRFRPTEHQLISAPII